MGLSHGSEYSGISKFLPVREQLIFDGRREARGRKSWSRKYKRLKKNTNSGGLSLQPC